MNELTIILISNIGNLVLLFILFETKIEKTKKEIIKELKQIIEKEEKSKDE